MGEFVGKVVGRVGDCEGAVGEVEVGHVGGDWASDCD